MPVDMASTVPPLVRLVLEGDVVPLIHRSPEPSASDAQVHPGSARASPSASCWSRPAPQHVIRVHLHGDDPGGLQGGELDLSRSRAGSTARPASPATWPAPASPCERRRPPAAAAVLPRLPTRADTITCAGSRLMAAGVTVSTARLDEQVRRRRSRQDDEGHGSPVVGLLPFVDLTVPDPPRRTPGSSPPRYGCRGAPCTRRCRPPRWSAAGPRSPADCRSESKALQQDVLRLGIARVRDAHASRARSRPPSPEGWGAGYRRALTTRLGASRIRSAAERQRRVHHRALPAPILALPARRACRRPRPRRPSAAATRPAT